MMTSADVMFYRDVNIFGNFSVVVKHLGSFFPANFYVDFVIPFLADPATSSPTTLKTTGCPYV